MSSRPGVHVSRPGGPAGITAEIRVFAPAGTDRTDVLDELAGAYLDARREIIARAVWPLPPRRPLPLHRTEAGTLPCSTCDGGGCFDCTDPA